MQTAIADVENKWIFKYIKTVENQLSENLSVVLSVDQKKKKPPCNAI